VALRAQRCRIAHLNHFVRAQLRKPPPSCMLCEVLGPALFCVVTAPAISDSLTTVVCLLCLAHAALK
jgi:hypothetical protein